MIGRIALAALLAGYGLAFAACAQPPARRAQKAPAPPTDRAALASPAATAPPADPVDDAAAVAGPTEPLARGASVAPGSAIAVRLETAASSATVQNGQTLAGTLARPLRLSNGHMIESGEHVALTVVSAAPAGKIASAGELNVQVDHIGRLPVASDVLTIQGQPGPTEPPGAPAKGTEAILQSGAELTFHVPALPPLPALEPAVP